MAKDTQPASSAGSTMGFVAVLVVLGLLGGGAGFSLKFMMPAGDKTGTNAANSDGPPEAVKPAGATVGKGSADTAKETLMPLEPIIVTLAEPKNVRMRMEASVIFAEAAKLDRGVLLREISQDLMTFLKTTTLAQIESASGLEYLRDDLTELVQLRSKGSARGLAIKALMVE